MLLLPVLIEVKIAYPSYASFIDEQCIYIYCVTTVLHIAFAAAGFDQTRLCVLGNTLLKFDIYTG